MWTAAQKVKKNPAAFPRTSLSRQLKAVVDATVAPTHPCRHAGGLPAGHGRRHGGACMSSGSSWRMWEQPPAGSTPAGTVCVSCNVHVVAVHAHTTTAARQRRHATQAHRMRTHSALLNQAPDTNCTRGDRDALGVFRASQHQPHPPNWGNTTKPDQHLDGVTRRPHKSTRLRSRLRGVHERRLPPQARRRIAVDHVYHNLPGVGRTGHAACMSVASPSGTAVGASSRAIYSSASDMRADAARTC